jgi:hypothetical protein
MRLALARRLIGGCWRGDALAGASAGAEGGTIAEGGTGAATGVDAEISTDILAGPVAGITHRPVTLHSCERQP